MESITQGALGALCGEITLRKQLGWKGIAWGIFLGTLPDLDILVYPWLEPAERLLWHRGLSHSILICIIASFVFGWLLAKLHRKKGVTFKQATGFVFLTWFTHVLIDCFNSYGTQIYEPFTSHRFALNNMAIIDLAFTLPMLVSILLVLFHDKKSKTRTRIGRIAAIWLCLYTAASFTIKYQAKQYFNKQLNARGIKPTRMMTSPTISNIFLWRMLAESEGQYHIAYWSIFDDEDRPCRIESTPNGHSTLDPLRKYPETGKLIWFAEGFYKIVQDPENPGSVLFIDMRFGEMVTDDSKRPPFVWRLTEESNQLKFQTVGYRKNVSISKTLTHLWQRIQGNAPDWMQVPWPWELVTSKDTS